MQEMFMRSALVALVVLSSLIFVSPGLAQNAVWRIDSEHSTGRLFLASSSNLEATVNVGVARMNGLVTRNAGDSAMPDFDFTIYPADKTASRDLLQQEQNNKEQGRDPDYTVINFKSTHVVRVDTEAFRVTGDLTLTYVESVATLDPSEAYSGPVYEPAITHSVRQEAVFEFRQVDPSGAQAEKKGNAEWFAVSTISGENFPELFEAVSTTNWPTFIADEHCVTTSTIGEDYSGPACSGETVEPAPRKDLHCEMPTTVGQDYAGEVCTQASSHVVTTDVGENRLRSSEPSQLIANAVKIELDLHLISTNVAPGRRLGQ
jgi:polyisoprenoid-binding protein YceI